MELAEALAAILPGEDICRQEPMARHTTFRTGGPAAWYLRVGRIEALRAVIDLLQTQGAPYTVLGNGSNVLVSDEGYDGVVLRLTGEWEAVGAPAPAGASSDPSDILWEVGAGAGLGALCQAARDAGADGLVFASGIPGTVGGALVMNAGAFGGEMADVVSTVTVFDPNGGRMEHLNREEMAFGYRTSAVKGTDRIILSAGLRLTRGDAEEIGRRMAELAQRRRDRQPLEYPSAGSTFQRPSGEGLYAGRLIEEAGLSGYAIGDAQVSEKHCGFVINRGAATSAQVYALICEVQRRVEEHSGIRLEPEVLFLGHF